MDYLNSPKVRLAAKAALHSRVLAYPTEAVWGLGCDPFNAHAVRTILALKGRPEHKGLILVAGNIEQIEFLLEGLSAEQRATLEASWPGPHTWLIPHHQRIPSWVCGKHDSVAVRVSAHPIVQALCAAFDGPIISTSANPQARAPARTGFRARQYFANSVFYVPGQVNPLASPSSIRDLITGQTLR